MDFVDPEGAIFVPVLEHLWQSSAAHLAGAVLSRFTPVNGCFLHIIQTSWILLQEY